jgi:hypothetical protein
MSLDSTLLVLDSIINQQYVYVSIFCRFEKLYYGRKRFKTEGLNSLEYQRIAVRSCKLFTWILVELTAPPEDESLLDVLKNSYFAG